MNDKQFVGIVAGFVGCLVILVSALTWCLPESRYMDGEYPYWMQQKDYVMADGGKREVLLLGDSRMKMDVRADALGDAAYNLALGGGTPLEMYYAMKRYLEHHPAPVAVIIGFGPTHYAQMDCYAARNLYFHYFDRETARQANRTIYELDGRDYAGEERAYRYRLPSLYMKPVLHSLVRPRTQENEEIYTRASVSKGRMYGKDEAEQDEVYPQETAERQFAALPSLAFYMDELIQLCRKNGTAVYVEQLPMGNPGHQRLIDSGYMAGYQSYLKALQARNGVYVNTEIPLYEAKYFQDGSHLNDRGARKFTQEWKEKYAPVLGDSQ